MAVGREIHGRPKPGGDPCREARGDLLVGTVSRNGLAVITATWPFKQHRADPAELLPPGDFWTNINLKVVTGVDGQLAIRQLTARRLENVSVHECWSGPATVALRPNAQAPVDRLPVRARLSGGYWRTESTLPSGRALQDYLASHATRW